MTITINCSALFSHREPWDCSNSVANLGDRAGEFTWNCALELAEGYQSWLLSSLPDTTDAVLSDARETGAWDRDELDDWSIEDCLAYLVQTIARELRMLESDDNELFHCVAKYRSTDWDKEPECPIGYYYMKDGNVMVDIW